MLWSYRSFLQAIIAAGVMANEQDDYGLTPIDILLRDPRRWETSGETSAMANICIDLIERGANITSVPYKEPLLFFGHTFYSITGNRVKAIVKLNGTEGT
jgi:hypothetical protein